MPCLPATSLVGDEAELSALNAVPGSHSCADRLGYREHAAGRGEAHQRSCHHRPGVSWCARCEPPQCSGHRGRADPVLLLASAGGWADGTAVCQRQRRMRGTTERTWMPIGHAHNTLLRRRTPLRSRHHSGSTHARITAQAPVFQGLTPRQSLLWAHARAARPRQRRQEAPQP